MFSADTTSCTLCNVFCHAFESFIRIFSDDGENISPYFSGYGRQLEGDHGTFPNRFINSISHSPTEYSNAESRGSPENTPVMRPGRPREEGVLASLNQSTKCAEPPNLCGHIVSEILGRLALEKRAVLGRPQARALLAPALVPTTSGDSQSKTQFPVMSGRIGFLKSALTAVSRVCSIFAARASRARGADLGFVRRGCSSLATCSLICVNCEHVKPQRGRGHRYALLCDVVSCAYSPEIVTLTRLAGGECRDGSLWYSRCSLGGPTGRRDRRSVQHEHHP